MAATKEKIEIFLSYLSETHTKCLALYDLISIQPRTDETDVRILVNINEVFTYFHSVRVFYYSNEALAQNKTEPFFDAFEDFYFELKQVFLHEDTNIALLYKKLDVMKSSFEELTNWFNVL
ncbi:hypothetical protein IW492_13425 [Enterococcus sp. BWB1-3]|uniref:hypothetical protein n=1 Tax=unclassified Enterococcus TaxID=2608891 RepID=UPI001920996C|nr:MULTISPECIES: hypothetical protein [unclassified Enterococcus]MBL1230232.1 hypothetical protein [Enterococcus sp. BWB1-3]MCB5953337.1 hypothetical protein [Enterococcus sp. BWT-B8]MCB5955759.1 hypothetical protein [Enterococcus sp. CWB-B31]